MININLDKHRETMEELDSFGKLLVQERENQLGFIDDMTNGWRGLTADTVRKMFPNWLMGGLHENVYQQTVQCTELWKIDADLIKSEEVAELAKVI